MLRSLVITALLALPISAFGQQQAPTQPVQAPELKAGDSWTYTLTSNVSRRVALVAQLSVTAVSPDGFTVEGMRLDTAAPVEVSFWDSQWNRMHGQYVPTKKNFEFPLDVGKRWAMEYTRATTDGRGVISFDGEATVSGWEQVTVKAGTFDTLRIETRTKWQIAGNGATGQDLETYWYAPKAKRLVKYTFRVLNASSAIVSDLTQELDEYHAE